MVVVEKAPPIFLNYEEKTRQIIITPKDQDRYYTTVDAAIKACKAAGENSKCNIQIGLLFQRLITWTKENKRFVTEAYLNVRETGLLFLVVQKQTSYDSVLEDSLTSLDLEIARSVELDTITLDILSLPATSEETVQSFLTEKAFDFLGHAK